MKLSDLRPCDNCGGKIIPIFYVVRYSTAVMNVNAIQQDLGMARFFGGNLDLAEVFSAHDSVVNIAMDNKEFKSLMTEILLCQECYTMKDINLAILAEKVHDRTKVDPE